MDQKSKSVALKNVLEQIHPQIGFLILKSERNKYFVFELIQSYRIKAKSLRKR